MPRDLEYERANAIEEDGQPCIKCQNYLMCKSVLPLWWHDCNSRYTCLNCDKAGFSELNFRHETHDCPVCLQDTGIQVQFPAGCAHWFCCECSRRYFYGDNNMATLDPCAFGCPPCPNGCQNPTRGPQCNCPEYWNGLTGVGDVWASTRPDEFAAYKNEELESIQRAMEHHNDAPKSCPLCRADLPPPYWLVD